VQRAATVGRWRKTRLTLTSLLPTLRPMKVRLTCYQQPLVRQVIASGRLHDEGDAVREALSLGEEPERAELLAPFDTAEESHAWGDERSSTRESLRELAEDVKRDLRTRLAAQ
jgi:Arc/MetJ-type ribon-helix-helix transcriptional regulator